MFSALDLAVSEFACFDQIVSITQEIYYARQLASNDFKNMLEKYYVEYREENFYVILDNKKLTESQFHLERPHDLMQLTVKHVSSKLQTKKGNNSNSDHKTCFHFFYIN